MTGVHIASLGSCDHVYVAYFKGGRITHDEVLCRPCFDRLDNQGAFQPSDVRKREGIAIKPWTGEDRCSSCDDTASVPEEAQARR